MRNIENKIDIVKNKELEILVVVHNFCVKHNIKYSLIYGTLLGAVRHKGFIPWDDDIDICMPRDDYERFIIEWNKCPVDGFVLQNKYTDNDFTQIFTKIRMDNSCFLQEGEEKYNYHKGIFIDIFPFDFVPKNRFLTRIQIIIGAITLIFSRDSVPETNLFSSLIVKFILAITPNSIHFKIFKCFNKLYSSFDRSNSPCFVCGAILQDLIRYYPSEMFDKITNIEFEEKTFYASALYKDILTERYGDYLSLPPVDERVWKHRPILIDFNNNYENIKANNKE